MYLQNHKETEYDYDAWLEYYASELTERSLFDDDRIRLCALKCLKNTTNLDGILGPSTIESLLQFLINQATDKEEDSFTNLMTHLQEELLDKFWPQTEHELENISGLTIIGGREYEYSR